MLYEVITDEIWSVLKQADKIFCRFRSLKGEKLEVPLSAKTCHMNWNKKILIFYLCSFLSLYHFLRATTTTGLITHRWCHSPEFWYGSNVECPRHVTWTEIKNIDFLPLLFSIAPPFSSSNYYYWFNYTQMMSFRITSYNVCYTKLLRCACFQSCFDMEVSLSAQDMSHELK